MTYMLLNCALKLVEEIILYYDARSKKHKNTAKVASRWFLIQYNFFVIYTKYGPAVWPTQPAVQC